MARGVRLTRFASFRSPDGRAWAAVAAAFGLFALLAWPMPRDALDWQPGLFTREPWRAFTSPFVHLSALHLGANLAGTIMVGLLGRVARVGPRSVLAWVGAWPVTQVALLAQPALQHYAGLSGLLHAGVAVVGVALLFERPRSGRLVGAGLLLGLAAKIALESPWSAVLRHPAGWDIAVAPMAHATGAIAGLLLSLIAESSRGLHSTRRRFDSEDLPIH